MSTRLRLALAVITASLLGTIVWIWLGEPSNTTVATQVTRGDNTRAQPSHSRVGRSFQADTDGPEWPSYNLHEMHQPPVRERRVTHTSAGSEYSHGNAESNQHVHVHLHTDAVSNWTTRGDEAWAPAGSTPQAPAHGGYCPACRAARPSAACSHTAPPTAPASPASPPSPVRQAAFMNGPSDDPPDEPDDKPMRPQPAQPKSQRPSHNDAKIVAGRDPNVIEDLVVYHKDINDVLALLSRYSKRKILASEGVKGDITVSLPNTTVDEALEKILKVQGLVARVEGDYTLVYTPEELEKVEQRELRANRIYKPNYVSAADLIQVLTDHLSKEGKISSTRANQGGIQSNAENAGADSLAVYDVVVVQDVEPVLKKLDRIVAEIDVRPPQVLIESMLFNIQLDNEHQMGVNLALMLGDSTLAVGGNGATLNASAGFRPSALVDSAGKVRGQFTDNNNGLKFGVIRGDFQAFVKMLETVGHTTVLADSKVLTMNKMRGEIQVGSQLGYKTTTATETSTVENVQFLDVGTQLRVRPFVQRDGLIRMEIHPEKSSGRVSETTGLPEKDTSQVTSNLAVPSGTTIVIGGLIDEQQQRTVQQIPFLGSVPLIGPLFRDETTKTTRNELIVLITPRIVSDEDLADAACIAQDRFEGRRHRLKDALPQHTRLALARRYYEKACTCFDQGDRQAALELSELALHFDPFYDSAINLRDEIQLMSAHPATKE